MISVGIPYTLPINEDTDVTIVWLLLYELDTLTFMWTCQVVSKLWLEQVE